MSASTLWNVAPLAVVIGLTACDQRSPAGPSPPPAVRSAPNVTAISPSIGSTARPTPVTISGTGFLAGATVKVDVMALRVNVVNGTTITAVVPAHSAGLVDVVVTNPDGADATLAAAFTYTLEGPVILTASADVVAAGGEISVSWTAPGARPGDWLAVFRVGGSYDDDWWGDTGGATSGSQTLTAPTRPGQYEFRYLVDGGFVDVARSSPVTVR